MADYKRMYTLLCKTIDDVIDPLAQIPAAKIYALHLQTEEIYISTTPYAEETSDSKIIQMKTDIAETRNRSRSIDLLRLLFSCL